MMRLRRFLVGALSVLSIVAVSPTVGASASVLDSGKNLGIVQNFDTSSYGVSSATGWSNSNLNKSIATAGTSTASAEAVKTTTKANGWNFTSVNDITFKKDGQLVKGWSKGGDGVEYRFYDKTTGIMKTGWVQDGGLWYYLHATGRMASNEYVDGYYMSIDGHWDSSRDNKSRPNSSGIGRLYSTSSLSSSRFATESEFASLKAQGKLGVTVTYGEGQSGIQSSGLDFYVK